MKILRLVINQKMFYVYKNKHKNQARDTNFHKIMQENGVETIKTIVFLKVQNKIKSIAQTLNSKNEKCYH